MRIASRHPLNERHESCTGCGVCVAKCPIDCMRMQPDHEGFLHPQIQADDCTDCGACRQVCPISHPLPESGEGTPRSVFAAWHLDETIRRESSSGGVFSALAQAVFERGGVVVGAAFDDQLVVRHEIVDSLDELHRLRGSKYVQSEVSTELYRSIRDMLDGGRIVLFSGTPCQVAGLRKFLGEPRENLVCCDFICKGVPSPLLLNSYFQYCEHNDRPVVSISFRDKTFGWKKPSVRVEFACGDSKVSDMLSEHPYTVAFARNCALRAACYACHFCGTSRTGDLTIADFWGVGNKYPEYDQDDKGTSLILANTKVGQNWVDACRESLFVGPADLKAAMAGNPMLVRSAPHPPERDTFYQDLVALPFSGCIRKYRLHRPPLWRRLRTAAKRKVKRALLKFFQNHVAKQETSS